ncbi:Cell division cycle-associated 7-like protein [Thalictrum thalictroides]|uniref:Cell division cycle-associated 7-like protein n=1 Tax=Thalictrum thalictroides TaxID=46969 RepID=A0A7J6VSB2_THATH|nr:Cell division cycle-associated 7-like protein [Thalictrum thalictroides]
MVTLRKRPRTLETPVNPKQTNNNSYEHEETQSNKSEEVFDYEQCREKRIKENMERMQKLGIFDLSSKLKYEFLSPKRTPRKPYERKSPLPSSLQLSLPPRRSTRLQNVTPVSYSELPKKKGKREKDLGPLVKEGKRPEIYTEEHEKQLGTCNSTWTLFVDGYGKDGKRIYDQVLGKTCHQCRQKTLGHHTHCIKCNLVQGQFCGDCLYMRYGEHVLEVKQNPNWICPVCRGICNCSLCRQAKGWPATGALYRKISKLGFKSVAHYLIETRRAETKSGEVCTDDPVSVKRSLPFADTEEPSEHKDSLSSDDRQHGSSEEKDVHLEGEQSGSPNSEIVQANARENEKLEPVNGNGFINASDDEKKGEKKEFTSEHRVSNVAQAYKVNPDSISGRLRSRRNRT